MVGCLAIMWDPSLLFVTVHVVLDEKPQKKHENVATCNFQKIQKCGRETPVKHP